MTVIHVYGADNIVAGEFAPSKAEPAAVEFGILNFNLPARFVAYPDRGVMSRLAVPRL